MKYITISIIVLAVVGITTGAIWYFGRDTTPQAETIKTLTDKVNSLIASSTIYEQHILSIENYLLYADPKKVAEYNTWVQRQQK